MCTVAGFYVTPNIYKTKKMKTFNGIQNLPQLTLLPRRGGSLVVRAHVMHAEGARFNPQPFLDFSS